jgi:ubiquinone biosynthesis protein
VTVAGARADAAARAPSTLRRYRDVATVLARHGLADVVDALHLGRSVAWGTRVLPAEARMDPSLSRAARVRQTLEELGPTFVKFGQALSVRADVVPPEYVAEFAKLQDAAAPLPPGEAERAIEAELGQPLTALFRRFEAEPFAAASIAQAHHAELPDGTSVVVKVRRPGITSTIAADCDILRQLAGLIERRVPASRAIDPSGLVDEFSRSIRAELDFAREGRSIERCARPFAGDASVRFPRVDWPRTRAGVLTLERLDGVKITSLDRANLGPFARRLIARRGADAMLRQILEHGFFHADPHPGNLLVLPDAVVGFIDFGIVGRLDARLRSALARIIRAVWRRDAGALAALAVEIGRPLRDVDRDALERDLAALIETYADVPLGELRMTDVLVEVVGTASRHALRLPSNLLLLVKAIVTIEGVGRQLDPSFRMVRHAAPFAERLLRREHAPEALAQRVQDGGIEALRQLRDLPAQLAAIVRKAQQGRLEVQFVHRNLEHFEREVDRSSNRIAFALVIAALIVGSSLLTQTGADAGRAYSLLGLAGFIIAGFFGIGLAIGIVRSGRL